MINDLDIVQWEYLLSPEFELINSAGKPLTGGWIEVYLHGTRDKYYCASDFNGTLHPFKIPLDSIGANVVLADPNNAYDVYVYNKFGSLIMSRYNVKCQGSGGSSTYVGDKLYYGQYRASNVTTIANLRRNKGNINITDDGYLKLKSGMSYHITVRGSFTVDDPANEDTTLNYIEYTSVNPIKIDIDETKEGPQYFELSYDIYRLQEDMNYQVAFAQSNGMVTDLIVEVHSLSNLATSATGGDQEYEPGWGINIVNNVISVDPSIFEDYTYTAGDYISIDDNNVISVTGINPGDFATHDEVYEATVTAIELVTGMIPDAQVQSDWNETDTEDPAYIKNKPDLDIYATHDEVNTVSGQIIETVNNVSGVLHEEITNIDLSDYSTHTEVYNATVTAVQVATGAIPEMPEEEEVDFEEIDLNDYALASAIPDISNLASHTEVYEATVTAIDYVTGIIPEAQVQADWNQNDNTKPDYINNKPTIPSIEGLATVEQVSAVSGYLQNEIDNIPGQVQSDWTQNDNTQVDYIKNKPEEYNLVAGENIAIAVTGSDLVISSTGGGSTYTAGDNINIDNDVISVKDVIMIHARPNSASGQSAFGNVTHWGNQDYGPGWWISAHTDNNKDYVSYNTSDLGQEEFFWGEYATDRENDSVSAVSYLSIHEGDITYKAGEFQGTGTLPIVWSCNKMAQDITNLQSAITAIPSTVYTAGTGIDITNNTISVDNTVAMKTDIPVVTGFATKTELATVEAEIPTLPADEEVVFEELDLSDYALASAIPVVSGFATKSELSTVEAEIPTVQLNSSDEVISINNYPIHSEGGGTTYTAGTGIDINNNVISVSGVAMASALPTTELGKFTIKNNVSGGPIEVICPTDQGHPVETVILDNTAVSGTSGSGTTQVLIVYKSPGYDDDYYSAEGSAILHIPEAVTGLYSLQLVYAPNSNPVSTNGPSFFTPQYIYSGTSDYVLAAGDYDLTVVANQVPQSPGGYGKYITLQAAGPAPDVQALLNSSVSLAVRHPELGITVNLDRYSLGNTNTITNTYGYYEAAVYTDPTTKKQTVYLPSSMPNNWSANGNIAQAFQYGSNGNSPSIGSYRTKLYKAYKYTSSPERYQFAYCTDWDRANNLMTFIAYDNSGNAIEKWTLDYTTYGSNVWTTTPISSGGGSYTAGSGIDITNDVISVDDTVAMASAIPVVTGYIPYSASGVVLPNSKFEIDTEGQAYKITATSTETAYGAWNGDGSFAYGNIYSLPTRNADGTCTLKAGTYRFTLPDTANSIKVFVAGNTAAAYNGMVIPATNHVADLVITEDLTFKPYAQGNDWININGFTNNDGTGYLPYPGITSSTSSAVYISPPVVEEYLTDGDLELNGSNQVTAIDGYSLAGGGGTTYTAGEHISIENDEIAVTGITELVAGNAITITTSGASAIISSTGEAQVQANWNETDTDSKAYIQNKPTIPDYTGASGIVIDNDTISLDNPIGLVAGNNITIEVSGVSAIISSTGGGGGSSYTAGTGIDITSDVISVDNTVAMKTDIPVVTGFATKTELATVEAEIPTLPTEEEVDFEEIDLNDYALVTAIPDVSTLATKSELQTVSAAIPDTTDMATQTWVGSQGYLTSVPSNYVTDSELNGAVSGLATTTEVTTGLGTKQNTLTGITDVQVVNSLPVSPVSSVLYLIPEA